MNHQEAKDILEKKLNKDSLTLIKVEVFRLSWQGKGYNIIAEESGYDHDYVRKAGSQLWKELSIALSTTVTKRNFRSLLEQYLSDDSQQNNIPITFPSGVISFSSPFYVERTSEEAKAYAEIQKPGSIVRIKGPRKMGKSSLMLRVIDHAESEGVHPVIIDLMQADRQIMSNIDSLLRWICLHISQQLEIPPAIDDYWNPLIGSKLSCTNYIQDHILSKLSQPLLIVINELNLLFDFEEVSKDFLPLLRSWHEESKHNDEMKKLRQLLIYSTEVYVQLDINLSPFNVGLPIVLSPLNGQQIVQLAKTYGFNWKNDESINSPITQLLTKMGGHPYLVHMALYQLATQSGFIESPTTALKQILNTADEHGSIFDGFLQQLLLDVIAKPDIIKAFNKILNSSEEQLGRIEMYQLEHVGIIKIANGKPVILSRLIANFLKNNL